MKREPLDDLLNLLKREEMPAPPPGLGENVFRTIRQRQAQDLPDRSVLNDLLGIICRPGFVAAVLALAAVTGTATTAIAVEVSARMKARSDAPAWASEVVDIELLKHSDHVLACCRPAGNER